MMLAILRFTISSIFLVYASFLDITKREVPDRVWVVSIPVCLGLDCIDLSLENLVALPFLVSIGISLLLGFSLCFMGFYGGADAKALLLIAVAVPSYFKANSPLFRLFPVPILLIFICSTILSAIYPLAILFLNVTDFVKGKKLLADIEVQNWFKKLILYLTSRKVKFEELKKAQLKYFPAEKISVENGVIKRLPIYFIRSEANIDEMMIKLETHKALLEGGVLVLPTIPMVCVLTLGFVITSFLSF
ncbi:MAG: prepilin peptidase [Candidatus Bathyarchaeota archaeon]